MTDNVGGTRELSVAAAQRMNDQVEKWRNDLVNLTKRNRLLYFKHTRSASFELTAPSGHEILRRLEATGSSEWRFCIPAVADNPDEDPPPVDRAPHELLIGGKDAQEIGSGLKQLERRTNHEFVDRGLWTLYVAFGELGWIEADDGNRVESPLLLVPVSLARESLKDHFRLTRTDDDAVLNPALSVKLNLDFGIELPRIDEIDVTSLDDVYAQVGRAVGGRSGWRVRDRAVLSNFTFHKEAMYRDLLDNEEQLTAHPIIRAMALGQAAPEVDDFAFEPVPEDHLDLVSPPEDLLSVVDADSSQRQSIVAAREGHSFVMDGPPGTGKSQTITNLVAELIGNGQSVLFVSEKAAALDVVQNRLKSVGLDPFALELHSHNATRKAVAAEFGRALRERPRSGRSLAAADRASLRRSRESLSEYVQALNENRQPLGRSLQSAIGRVVALQSLSQAPIPTVIDTSLTVEQFDQIQETGQQLARSWGPVARGDDFLWRDLVDVAVSQSRRQSIVRGIDDAATALDNLDVVVDQVDSDVVLGWRGSIGDATRLREVIALAERPPAAPPRWLSRDDLAPVRSRVSELAQMARSHGEGVDRLAALVGPRWADLPVGGRGALDRVLDTSAAAEPPIPLVVHSSPDAVSAVQGFAADGRRRLGVISQLVAELGAFYGLTNSDVTLARAFDLAGLSSLASAPVKPEAAWLNPLVHGQLDAAAAVLRELVSDYSARRAALAEVFTPEVLNLDLAGLHVRFRDVHRGFRKFSGACRADKRTLASCAVSGRANKAVISRVGEALAWQEMASRLSAAELQHSGALGPNYYRRESTDFDQVISAIEVARKAVQLAGQEMDAASVQRQIALSGQPDPAAVEIGRRLTDDLTSFVAGASSVGIDVDGLRALSLSSLGRWLEHAQQLAGQVESQLDAVNAGSEHPLAIGLAAEALGGVETVRGIHRDFESNAAADHDTLGGLYAGLGTDWGALGAAIDWAESVRSVAGGPVPRRSAEVLTSASLSPAGLTSALEAWSKRREAVLASFSASRGAELGRDLDVSFDDARMLLQDLAGTVDDIQEWDTFDQARTALVAAGLGPAVEHCIETRCVAEAVPSVIERATLEAWIDAVLESDRDRLGALRAVDRDALVEKFRQLDQQRIATAAGEVIDRCSARRPTSTAGVAGVIQREAQKKSRHMPIRDLLDKAGPVAQRLKPCFMMSPLAVSQYLPPSLRFDVVIFDEASQVLPADAVNCIYRGDRLIVAGDQKQLPPTSFFTASVDTDDVYDEDQLEEFESVLDLCKGSGGLPSLSLNWHYRSQHESLITYSNYRFYEGGLWTYPGAVHEAPDVGLELFLVDGMYRRGGGRDNPVEAAKVIDRVLYHRRNHPDLSLGVVAFSSAQEDAIYRELEARSGREPELAGLINDDRLHGFFIKNLENVQGDERDIIVFSVGYGPDEHGKFTLQLGPLNRQGGWRRLNVAITRAKRRVEIVSSVRASDFPAEPSADGVRHLKNYLDFAERGVAALALDLEESAGDAESPFEEEVISTVRGWGFDAVPQVGVAGYRIDLAVRHPARPGSFALGIECDGAMYHSSKTARDRDRLRQGVLEGLGWHLHRIWGPSWYRDRSGQEARLRAAIDDAIAGRARKATPDKEIIRAVETVVEEAELDGPPAWASAYRPAAPPAAQGTDIRSREAGPAIERIVVDVVDTEGPVHEQRVMRAVLGAWGKNRAGALIKESFDRVVARLARTRIQRSPDGFLSLPDQTEVRVRIPVDDEGTRPIRHVPPSERQRALMLAATDAQAIDHEQLRQYVARLFGWRRVGAEISAVLDDDIDRLVESGALAKDGTLLRATGRMEEQTADGKQS